MTYQSVATKSKIRHGSQIITWRAKMSILTQELISWYLRASHLRIWSTRPGRLWAGLGQVRARRRVSMVMVRVMVMVGLARADWAQDVLAPAPGYTESVFVSVVTLRVSGLSMSRNKQCLLNTFDLWFVSVSN